jgi:hypothetical protein
MRTVTGVLSSRPTSRDIKIDGFSMGLNGVELIQDCSIEVTIGRRYGLLGQNGSGKTNFLCALANREVRRPPPPRTARAPFDRRAPRQLVWFSLPATLSGGLRALGPERARRPTPYTRVQSGW